MAITNADIKSAPDNLLAKITTVKNDLNTVKGDQSRLAVAVNHLQTEQLEMGDHSGSSTTDIKIGISHTVAATNTSTRVHKLHFSEYKGKDDPITWLHRCEQFFRSQLTPEEEKVWMASYYMTSMAQQ